MGALETVTNRLINHPVYYSLHTLQDVQVYMEHQVWCVWDFMALLKSLQCRILSTAIAWTPPKNAVLGYCLYEILLSEETDFDDTLGTRCSHFESYLRAMSRAGANRQPIESFIARLREGESVRDALSETSVPSASREFVENTLKVTSSPLHCAIAAFCLSREGLIPNMFTTLLQNLTTDESLDAFIWYLQRHVVIDKEKHGPLSEQMLEQVIGNDSRKCSEALETALSALNARLLLLDRVYEALPPQDARHAGLKTTLITQELAQ